MSHEPGDRHRSEDTPPPEGLLPRDDSAFAPPHRPDAAASSGAPAARPPADGGGAGPAPNGSEESTPAPFPGTEDVDQEQVLSGTGYTSPRPSNDPLAVAAMVLGIGGLIPGVGLAAIVCGHLALRRLRGSRRGGAGLAMAGLVLGYALTSLWVLFYLATRALPT